MSNDYFKAQGWFKNYATSSEDSRGVFQELVKEDEEAFRLASAESDRIKAMMNEQYGPGTIKYGSEIPQPEIKTPQAAFEFSQRNPAAEGGRQGFAENNKLVKKLIPLDKTKLDKANFKRATESVDGFYNTYTKEVVDNAAKEWAEMSNLEPNRTTPIKIQNLDEMENPNDRANFKRKFKEDIEKYGEWTPDRKSKQAQKRYPDGPKTSKSSFETTIFDAFGRKKIKGTNKDNPNYNLKKLDAMKKNLAEYKILKTYLADNFDIITDLDHPLDKATIQTFMNSSSADLTNVNILERNLNTGFKKTLNNKYREAVQAGNVKQKRAVEKIAKQFNLKIGSVPDNQFKTGQVGPFEFNKIDKGVGSFETLDIKKEMLKSLKNASKLDTEWGNYIKDNSDVFKEAGIDTKRLKKPRNVENIANNIDEIEKYITDRTGKVKPPSSFIGASSGFNTDLIAEDLKKIVNSEGFKTFKAKIANPALKTAVGAAKLPTKIFGAADLVLGYFDYTNNRQKGFSKEDSTKHMVDAVLFGATSFGEKGDIEGVRKMANTNGMSNEVFDNLMAVNTNQKKFMDTVNKSKAKFNESMDIIESGAADPTAENMLIQKLKVDTKKSLTNTMENIVKDSRSLETNLQVQEAGAPININVDKEKAFSDLGSASRDFVQTRIDASDPKVFEQGNSTMGKIGNIFDKTLLDKEFMTKFAIGDYLGMADTKAIRNQKNMQKLKIQDPTLYYKMLQSEGIDPRINLNIPVQLEFEQKYADKFGTQMSDTLTQNKAEGGITGLRSKYEYKK
jgi:hypothetical protein